MSNLAGSCEVAKGSASGSSGSEASGSRVLRFQPGFRWEGVPVLDYKAPAANWCGIQRAPLVGERGEKTSFHVRYFEIAAGGFSSLEHHGHAHVVFVLRGRGEVRLGDAKHELGYGDVVYVGPHEVHQFRNTATVEPFGFLCMVDAERDTPVPYEN
jgi:quercetin dioxygenase-like cupin family protein